MEIIPNLNIIKAETWEHFLALRDIRNECRKFMTNDQQPISVLRQRQFFNRYKSSRHELWPLLGYLGDKPVAFGLRSCNNKIEVPWITGGVKEQYRGRGFGREMFVFLTGVAIPRPAYLEVLETNTAAYNLYKKIGWQDYATRSSPFGEVIIMMMKD